MPGHVYQPHTIRVPAHRNIIGAGAELGRCLIVVRIIDKDATSYADMVKSNFSNILQDKINFKDLNQTFFQTYINADRYVRYSNAEEIVDSIPYCARALKVIADEVVAPDDINKKVIQIKSERTDSEKLKEEEHDVLQINEVLEMEDFIHDIVYETLKAGDQFIEICNFKSKDVPLTQSLLTESKDYEPFEESVSVHYKDFVEEEGT